MEATSLPATDDSYNEYDATLDADASLVNWAAVPLVNKPPISSTSTQVQTSEHGIPRRDSCPDTSDDYGEDDYDDSFLDQLTQLEANVQSRSTSSQFPSSNVTHSTKESRPNAKRPRHSDLSNQSSPVSKRFRTEAPKSSPDAKARRIVEGYDEELTCPLCFDFFVATQVANPCGHSMCGPCIAEWMKKKSTCPICRIKLTVACPSLPNFSMDGTIEKHIASLRQTRVSGWETGGRLIQEREQRKCEWGASKKINGPQNASVPRPFAPVVELPASGVYRMYLAAHSGNGATLDEEEGSDDTSSDEESETPDGLPIRQPTPVPPREHFIDLARVNAPYQNAHRGERDRSRRGRARGNGPHRQHNRRPRPPRSRNGRGRGGRGGRGH